MLEQNAVKDIILSILPKDKPDDIIVNFTKKGISIFFFSRNDAAIIVDLSPLLGAMKRDQL